MPSSPSWSDHYLLLYLHLNYKVIVVPLFGSEFLSCFTKAITCACGAAAKLIATIECIPDIDSANPGRLKPAKVNGEITFEDVKFNYLSCANVPILKGINITFPAGKTTALVGASGSGKSMIVSLTEHFYDPLSGFVMLDGTDL
ncbi:hypothetical protein EV702DRAFT_1196468 [Suillus placidus]|uniref:ABC transporter domain-containing protein n=1 Tax=Suillus placidus TaxID=48579 RepID=A0A9P7D3F5_9AGAM|nr:hypothetical protein EV702DRAFT_1196468 [Suillus placidus]